MGKIYNNLITTTAGFNYPAQQPLDDRDVVQSYSDLAVLVSSNAAYEGIEVYVVDDKKSYKLFGTEWKAVATEEYINSRARVPTTEDLQALIDDNAAYDGMIVYVEADQKTYQAKKKADGKLAFEEFAGAQTTKIDDAPTKDSKNAVSSGGVYSAIEQVQQGLNTKQDSIIFSTAEPTDASVGTMWLDTSENTIAYAKGVGF